LPREDFRNPAEKYFDALLKLSAVIMRIISAGLPYSGVEETFKKFVADPVAILRLSHYPPGVTASASGERRGSNWQFCTY
jgi:isopenicillin N synthase-like dioxygenase